MKYLTLLILIASCNPKDVKAIDDFLEGEVKVAETVLQDEMGPAQKQ